MSKQTALESIFNGALTGEREQEKAFHGRRLA